MVDRLKQWSALIAVLALVYFAWSAWHQPAAKKVERERMPEVAQSNVQTRDSRETAARLRDPCKLDRGAPRVPMSASTSIASTLSIVKPGEIVRGSSESSLELSLDAIVFADSSAQALISGHTVKIGATIPGVDNESPPMLVWLDNVRAGVRYRGREYVLDLDRTRRVLLEPVAPPAKPSEAAPIVPGAPGGAAPPIAPKEANP
jgi:hypothetical protein